MRAASFTSPTAPWWDRTSGLPPEELSMFRNYLITALRNFSRHRLYSFVNVTGLAVGLACAVFIVLFVADELSYDSWIAGSDDLYRVEGWFYSPDRGAEPSASIPFPVAPAMAAHIPEVAVQTHLIPERMTMSLGDRQFSEYVDVVDPNFFQVVKLPLVRGDPASVFAQPESIVLSQEMARKYFGDSDPVGKFVTAGTDHPLRVTGVLRDLPHNTQLVADMMLPNTSKADRIPQSEKEAWLNADGEAFVRLAPDAEPDTVLAKLKPILDRNIDAAKMMNLRLPGSQVLQVHLTRFRDDHLTSDNAAGGMKPAGSWATIYGFSAIAFLIVLIACFNFMNLATARATLRAREVSLRKVVGASRRQLIAQFMGESVLTAVLALLLALALVEILTPAFDALVERPIGLHYLQDWRITLGAVAMAVGAGAVGGVYPAFVLSRFRPAAILKPSASGHWSSARLRTALVVMQFAISIGLGIVAIVVFAQIRYASRLDLGFDRDNIIVIRDAGNMTPAARDSMAQALSAAPSVAGVAQSGPVPFEHDITMSNVNVPGSPETYMIRTFDIAPEFPSVYGMKLVAGRNLSRRRGADESTVTNGDSVEPGRNVLVNAAAARRFGYEAADAPGRMISIGGTRVTIVGVLSDAKVDGVRAPVAPIIFYYNPNHIDNVSVRVEAGRVQDALTLIDGVWHKFAPNNAIRRRFLSDAFDKLLASDEKLSAMLGFFVGIAVLIACLGLFGLAAFTAERRTKEIGVRKVFGARSRDVLWLLLWQFSIPVLAANVIAWPVAWFYLSTWLESYAYHVELSPLYFLAAGLAAVLIAWTTVAAHSLRVARSSPAHALRDE
jgi:putative ABC transport system permease protein